MRRSLTIEIITALLIGLFVYASLSKLLSYPVFAAQLHTHPYLRYFAGFLAWAVPIVELGVAMLLIFSGTRTAGFYSSALLLFLFTAYLGLMLLSGKDLPCSCGGIISSLSWRQHIIFNGVFILLAITGIIFSKQTAPHKTALSFRL